MIHIKLSAASKKQATTQTVKEARGTIKLLDRQLPFSGSAHTWEHTTTKQLTY